MVFERLFQKFYIYFQNLRATFSSLKEFHVNPSEELASVWVEIPYLKKESYGIYFSDIQKESDHI